MTAFDTMIKIASLALDQERRELHRLDVEIGTVQGQVAALEQERDAETGLPVDLASGPMLARYLRESARRIGAIREHIRRLQVQREARLQQLEERRMELKRLETLAERRKEREEREAARREQKTLDELVTTRWRKPS